MKRLILTTSASGAGGLLEAKLADCVFSLCPRFVWGPLPSPAELETRLSSRSARREAAPGFHWLDFTGNRLEEVRNEGPGLIEFCGRFEAVELWVDPDPDDQLTLIWLLDYLRHHPETSSRLALIQSDVCIGSCEPEEWRRAAPLTAKVPHGHWKTTTFLAALRCDRIERLGSSMVRSTVRAARLPNKALLPT